MQYAQGLWIVQNGVRLPAPVWPRVEAFRYNDGTKDEGHWLLETFTVDWVPPGSSKAMRLTIIGSLYSSLPRFDWDGASIPSLAEPFVGERMGLTQQVPSLGHDGLYAAQLPDVPKSLADLYYRDAQGAYGAGVLARNTAYRAVDLFGSSAWNLPERQPNFDKYRHLVRVQWVPITL